MFNFSLILTGVIFILALCFILLMLSYILANDDPDSEKLSPYECGFSPFSDNRLEFDVKFFLVGILFIIFDLEISFLFPWSLTLTLTDFLSTISMFIFLFILTIGLVYEWLKGGLDWY